MSDGATSEVHGARDESLIRTLFPFFIAIDRRMCVTAVGPRWQTALPELELGASFSEHVVIDRPTDVTGFDAISTHDGAIFMLSLAKRPLFKLRGQFVRVEGDDGGDRLLFVGGPWFTSIFDLSALGLTMQDFPPHDPRGDFLVLLQTQESTNRDLRELAARLRSEMAKQRQLEEELRQIQKMELVGRFAGGIAHNFNNILMAIHGYTALALSRAPAGEQVRNSLEQIRLATDHAAALTRALLAMSRQHPLRIESLDLRREISELERLAKPLLGERVELICEVHPDAGRAQADSAALKQILMNLVLNARDALPKGGHVRIEARPPTTAPSESLRHGDFVEFLVSDDGIGMDEATKARIFEPFFTTKEVGKGVGLGLSSVYGLVEQLGGKITVESARSVGTTFHVFLPRIVGVAETKQIAPPIAHGGRGERVLLVEDESMVRQLLERVLSQAGYQVSSSLTSEAALKFATTGRPFDLVVTDVVMPGLTGPELATKIEEACGATPTIFMSGYSEDPALREGRLRSHQRFMPKPFAPPDLLVVIRELLMQYPRRDGAIV